MLPRALMAPPGIPDFATRRRFVRHGQPCVVNGRAWSGYGPVELVEVSVDGGASWDAAELDEQPDPWAWVGWHFSWRPDTSGEAELCCRARDSASAVRLRA